ncbi:nicotinate phosphoribosyltransferase-like [Tubulanus polymorphus]|uniref:nicotinate phosphoribosyltransferase-like n=1 Tax=Tubulanus polymorphus TaxID=672921 RepID=UPI003DA24026
MSNVRKRAKFEQNGIIQPLLTDFYQITMAYAYWKSGKKDDHSIFDLYFRKNPFSGEFTIFAGLEECLKFLKNFQFSDCDIDYLRSVLPESDDEFFDYLRNLDASKVTLYAIEEGSVVFPKVPLLRVEGPLPVVQLLETTFLTLVNYASLVATNAARFRLAAGEDLILLEFGLRRAQGPDGGLSASRYCYVGGFDGTSNVLAGKLFGIPLKGTHAHAFVNSFTGVEELSSQDDPVKISGDNGLKKCGTNEEISFTNLCLTWLEKIAPILGILPSEAHRGELAAFISYAQSFPSSVLCLIDTYDVVRSGLPNFCAVAMALNDLGYQVRGVRLDSGDLAYLSKVTRNVLENIAEKFDVPWFKSISIVASNDINEDTIHSLNQQGHSINCFGIGTHLVTCQKQPALGCVFKLVEVNDKPKIKLSEDVEKVTMPGRKDAYRLYGADGHALVDLLIKPGENVPVSGQRVLCRHPFTESKRAYVNPAKVECLYKCFWKDGKICEKLPSLLEIRSRTKHSLNHIRQDHKRALNPTPYKVSVTDKLYKFMHHLWLENAPIGELS